MDSEIELGTYTVEAGLRLSWQDGYRLRVATEDHEVLISGNAAGLRSLAQHLLTLAQDQVPSGVHAHLEPGLELEDNLIALVMEKDDQLV